MLSMASEQRTLQLQGRHASSNSLSMAPALSLHMSTSGSGGKQVSEEADGARILLTLEGKDWAQLQAGAAALRQALPPGVVVAAVEVDPVGLNMVDDSAARSR